MLPDHPIEIILPIARIVKESQFNDKVDYNAAIIYNTSTDLRAGSSKYPGRMRLVTPHEGRLMNAREFIRSWIDRAGAGNRFF